MGKLYRDPGPGASVPGEIAADDKLYRQWKMMTETPDEEITVSYFERCAITLISVTPSGTASAVVPTAVHAG
ncbi:MAG: hypothetical protein ACI87W_002249 [Halieaceae bacterium]|jgi:hypothetical protein